jgi:hypothetical protein
MEGLGPSSKAGNKLCKRRRHLTLFIVILFLLPLNCQKQKRAHIRKEEKSQQFQRLRKKAYEFKSSLGYVMSLRLTSVT